MMSARALNFIAKQTPNLRRNFGSSCIVLNKVSDPIQKLFLDQVKDYKSKSSGGKMVDSNPQIELEKKNELERVAKQFGGSAGVDMTKFPEFNFEDPKVDAITQ